ncbi:hypothetical protein [Thiomonas intermedia]|uniref:hypothetical protein n=1 Tax=Thiomonas intermedia TaxID=926 RepID=UPI0009A50719|nr:hypothetical protein [Thiomonas intermedia]
MPDTPEKPDTPSAAAPQRKPGMNVQLSGLLGIVIAIAVLVGIFSLLRGRLVNQPVDAPQLQLANDSPCMADGIKALAASGKAITYGQLGNLKKQCGEDGE